MDGLTLIYPFCPSLCEITTLPFLSQTITSCPGISSSQRSLWPETLPPLPRLAQSCFRPPPSCRYGTSCLDVRCIRSPTMRRWYLHLSWWGEPRHLLRRLCMWRPVLNASATSPQAKNFHSLTTLSALSSIRGGLR